MATQHQFVSFKSSCIKQPVHPSTGLPTSKTERESVQPNEFVLNGVSSSKPATEEPKIKFVEDSRVTPGNETVHRMSWIQAVLLTMKFISESYH